MPKEEFIACKTIDEVLKTAFAGWSFKGFTFPTENGDGLAGEKCISKAKQLFLRRRKPDLSWKADPDDTVGLLSAHIYFTANCALVKKSTRTLTLNILKFHMTVRRSKSQKLIDKAGASIMTAKEAIHYNRNSSWAGREENLKELVRVLESDIPGQMPFTAAEVVDFLENSLGYDKAWMVTAAGQLVDEAGRHLAQRTGLPVTVEADESVTGH
jgi:hypothetical protein